MSRGKRERMGKRDRRRASEEREKVMEREKEGGGADGGELSDFISGEVCLYGSYSALMTRHRGEGSPGRRGS